MSRNKTKRQKVKQQIREAQKQANPKKRDKTLRHKESTEIKSASGFGTVANKAYQPPNPNRFQSRSVRPNNLPSTPTEEVYIPQLGVDFDEEGNRY